MQGLGAAAAGRYHAVAKGAGVDWAAIKTIITEGTGLSRDALHLLTGFGFYLFLTALLPRRSWPVLPWFLVLIAALANEWADYLNETWPGQWRGSLKDMVTTLALPTLLILLSRFAPNVLVRTTVVDTTGKATPGLEAGNVREKTS